MSTKNLTITSQLSKKLKLIIPVQIFITIILFLSNNAKSYAQIKNNEEFILIEKLLKNTTDYNNNNKYKNFKDQSNILIYYLFVFYKNYISSQDASHCVFKPSCSEYAIKVISKQGIFPGLFNAIDRFSRCHGLSIENYEHDENFLLLIDPPTNWKYETIK